MDKHRLEQLISGAEEQCCREALSLVLAAHSAPVFGAAKAIEHEVAAFHALTKLGFLSEHPDEYELVMVLRITKSKARSLLYQVGLRRLETPESIDAALRILLSEPCVMKDRENIFIEVPDPLLMDCLRQRMRKLGFISDGSFSGSVAKIPSRALAALIADLIPDDERSKVKKQLRGQGVPGDDLAGLICGALGVLGKHAAGEAGERIGDKLGHFFVDGAAKAFDWARVSAGKLKS